MSSRNLRLSTEARSKATGIFREMKLIEQQLETRNLRQLENEACNNLLDSGFSSVDYISIARPETLEPLKSWQPGEPAVILAAAFIGGVRLIDNLPVNYPG
jgi:pantoate--beta-alanine ligase